MFREYDSIRNEILSALQQTERTFAYLLSLIAALAGALLALQQAQTVAQEINSRPWIYLLLAAATLWFPLQNVLLTSNYVVAATYLRDVLIPKLISILHDPMNASDALRRFLDWERTYFRERPEYSGPLAWEAYRSSVLYSRFGPRLLVTGLAVARELFLYVPFALLMVRYLQLRVMGSRGNGIAAMEMVLLGVLSTVLMLIVVATFTISNVPSSHRKRDKTIDAHTDSH